jgi:hypothetical protein
MARKTGSDKESAKLWHNLDAPELLIISRAIKATRFAKGSQAIMKVIQPP